MLIRIDLCCSQSRLAKRQSETKDMSIEALSRMLLTSLQLCEAIELNGESAL